jgi:hypothetical protein
MNRLLLAAMVGLAAALTAGCPIYSNDQSYGVCTSQGCFDCPSPNYSSACTPAQCATSFDCPYGYSCSFNGQCVAGVLASPGLGEGGGCTAPSDCEAGTTCGSDNNCHAGDCGSGIGCPSGYECTLVGGLAECRGAADGGADAGAAQTPDAAEAGGGGGLEAGDATLSETGPSDGGTCVDGSCQ